MKTILVTGRIGSGKSTVCRVLAAEGYPVYDCDSRTKALYAECPELIPAVEKAIGVPFENVGVIFSDPTKREALEAVVYPYVVDDIHRWKAAQNSDVVFVESAIALGKKLFEGEFDAVLLVRSDAQTRYSRNAKAALRDASQAVISLSDVDYVIDNDSSFEELEIKVKQLIEII